MAVCDYIKLNLNSHLWLSTTNPSILQMGKWDPGSGTYTRTWSEQLSQAIKSSQYFLINKIVIVWYLSIMFLNVSDLTK